MKKTPDSFDIFFEDLKSYVTDLEDLELAKEYLQEQFRDQVRTYFHKVFRNHRTKDPDQEALDMAALKTGIEALKQVIVTLHKDETITLRDRPEVLNIDLKLMLAEHLNNGAKEIQETRQNNLQEIAEGAQSEGISEKEYYAKHYFTLETTAETLSKNVEFDPAGGDWNLKLRMGPSDSLDCYQASNRYIFSFNAPSKARAFCRKLNESPKVAGANNQSVQQKEYCFIELPFENADQKQLMAFLLKNEYTTWEDATTFFDKLNELRREKGHEK